MRVCVFGAGGLGSVVGGYLAQSGVEVALVGRAAHVDAVGRNGLRISGIRGDFLIRDRLTAVTDAAELGGDFDFFILTVKGKDTERALAQARPLLPRLGCVLSLQNAESRHRALIQWAGPEKVLGAVTIEGGELAEPGHTVNHVTVPITAYFGELDGSKSRRSDAIAQAFTQARMTSRSIDKIDHAIWEKLTQISLASGWSVTALSGNPKLTFADGWLVAEGAQYYVQLAKELLGIYRALGYAPQNFFAPLSHLKELHELDFERAVAFVAEAAKALQARGYRGRTSMHKDVLSGRKTEVDEILVPFLRKADEFGLAVPTVRAAYRIVKTLDAFASA